MTFLRNKKNKVQNGPKRSKVHFEILTKMAYVLYSILKKKVFFDIILFGFLECVGCFMFLKTCYAVAGLHNVLVAHRTA